MAARTRGPRKPLIETPAMQTEAIVAAKTLGDILATPEGQALSKKAEEAGRYLGLLEATKAALDVAKFEDMAEKAQKIQSDLELFKTRNNDLSSQLSTAELKAERVKSELTLQPEDSAWLSMKPAFDKWLSVMVEKLPPVGYRKGYGLSWSPSYGDFILKKIVESESAIMAEKAISAAADARAEEKVVLLAERDATIASLKAQVEKARASAGEWKTSCGAMSEHLALQANRTETANKLIFAWIMVSLTGFLLQIGSYYRPAEKATATLAIIAGLAAFIAFALVIFDKYKVVADEPTEEVQ